MNELLKDKDGIIDYTPVLAAIAIAMQKYEESRILTNNFNIESDDYLKSREDACAVLDDAIHLLSQINSPQYPDMIQEMISSTRRILRDYYSFVVIPSFIDKKLCVSERKYFTYLIKNPETGLVKIGKSINVDERLKSLQCGAGIKLEKIGVIQKDIERKLHKKFESKNVFNEWFDDSNGDILEYFTKQAN